MANFKYKARDKFSRAVSGVLSASNVDAVAKKLNEMGYLPISIDEILESGLGRVFKKWQHIAPSELGIFTRQLYALQKAGLPVLSSLQVISESGKNKYFNSIITEIAGDIKGGLSLSESLKKYNQLFDTAYTSMIGAAETSGSMVEILERLTKLIEQEIDTQNRIKAATRYPIITFGVMCLAFMILIIFVIPRFAAIYSNFNAILPLPTRILIALNTLIQKFWYLFILGLGVFFFGFMRFINSKIGRPIFDNFKLKIPIFGPLISMLIMSRFARITAMLMKSGVPILEVLDLAANTSGNVIISRAILNIRENVNQGKGIAAPMKLCGLFPPIIVQMVSVGEQTGKVDELLLDVADYYDMESGYLIKNLVTYIEPVMISILAGMVLLMALAIFLPMWNLIKVFKPG